MTTKNSSSSASKLNLIMEVLRSRNPEAWQRGQARADYYLAALEKAGKLPPKQPPGEIRHVDLSDRVPRATAALNLTPRAFANNPSRVSRKRDGDDSK